MSDGVRETATIVNARGLHARAAAKVVACVGAFNAEVEVMQGEMAVTATSIMGLMMLAAKKGTVLSIMARGPDAASAAAALVALITNRFDEDE